MKTDVTKLSQEIKQLPPNEMADLFDHMSQDILSMTNQGQTQSVSNSGYLAACSKSLEQASTEILRFAQSQQTNNNEQNTMNNKNPKRLKRISIAQDTLATIERGHYKNQHEQVVDLNASVNSCLQQTKLLTPEQLEDLNPTLPSYESTQIEVVNETTLEGAKRLRDQQAFERIGILNFASAKNAGGGFLGGSQAQEESIARSSALYASLQKCPEYYDYHRKTNKSLLYSDHMIYSPDCPVFKLDSGELLAEPYSVDIITSAAPNRGALARNQPDAIADLDSVFIKRIRLMLKLAVAQGCDALVLGAWGCGVFCNEPEDVAAWFAEQLSGDGEFANSFKHISFSIPEDPRVAKNNLSFQQAFLLS